MVNVTEVLKGLLNKSIEQSGALNGKMEQWELLWENASPSSSFTAQTISLDLSEYDFVYITAVYTVNYRQDLTGICRKDRGVYLGVPGVVNMFRGFDVTDSGVDALSGIIVNTYGINSADDTRVVPTRIYGIK